jgi:hypothetical protein|tara:strand:+ start:262 stop:702 length:441 start_codon:yes stop_codon:yes gene_type:complete
MFTDLKSQLRTDLTEARKSRKRLEILVLSSLLAEVHNREIELGRDLDEVDVTKVITKAVKQRREASEMMRSGGRPELADKELQEMNILQKYLPAMLSESEIRAIIRTALQQGFDQMGSLMGEVMPKLQGRVDGKEVNRIVREELKL